MNYGYPVDYLLESTDFLNQLVALHGKVKKGKLSITMKISLTKTQETKFDLKVKKTDYKHLGSFTIEMTVTKNSKDKFMVVDFKMGDLKVKKL